jgi:hydrogenase maturation protease
VSGAARRVIGLGNALRGDDAAGLLAAEAVREQAPGMEVVIAPRDGAALVEAMDGADAVVIIDAVAGGGHAGEIVRLDAAAGPIPRVSGDVSGHGLGAADAVELARALGRLPPRVVVYGVRGERFSLGAAPCAAVVAAARRVAAEIVQAPAWQTPFGKP